MSQMDMSSSVVGPKSTTRYNLHAVSNHYGTMHGGHYTAFCKSVYDRKWYKFDDQYVTEMSPRDVVVCLLHLLLVLLFIVFIVFFTGCPGVGLKPFRLKRKKHSSKQL